MANVILTFKIIFHFTILSPIMHKLKVGMSLMTRNCIFITGPEMLGKIQVVLICIAAGIVLIAVLATTIITIVLYVKISRRRGKKARR